jgi:polyhydroxyalkanoate synthase
MTSPDDNATASETLFRTFAEQWLACVKQANQVTQQACGRLEGSADPRAWRRQWFDALSGGTDAYLRSPPFLRMMKAHIDALIQLKQSERHGAANSPSDAATASALATLSKRIAEVETTLRSRLEQLEQRVAALENAPQPATGEDAGWERFLDVLRVRRSAAESMMGVTPHEVVYTEGTLRLLRYKTPSVRFAEPILICFALVNRPYIMDLQAERSVVRQLLARGFDVYLIDWGIPAPADHSLRLEDYVGRLLRNVVEFVCHYAQAAQLNLLGYCMGGTMAVMYTALYPARVRNLILMAAPIDFGGEQGLLNLWARAENFDVDKLIDAYGNCPGEFLQYCFQLMKPVQNFAEKYLTFCDKLDDEAFLENFFALERWASDCIPVAGETFREYVKSLYQQNRLIQGRMSLGGAPIRLDAITCPLLILVAEHDHLVPPSSTLALETHVRSRDVQSMSLSVGHIGLAVSSKAQRDLWPRAAEWIAAHSTAITFPETLP